jgi:hypothetical protein
MIGVYDHATAGFVKYVKTHSGKDGCKVSVAKNETDAVAEIKDCDIVVCHVGQEAWKHLVSMKQSGVLIRVSTRGFIRSDFGTESMPDIVGRFIFHLCVDLQFMKSEDWKTILDTVKSVENCKSLVDGGNPAGIRHFFFPERAELVTALAVLCQGYLSTAALINAEPLDGPARLAIDLIGCTGVSPARGTLLSKAKLRQRMSSINQRAWWTDYLLGDGTPQDVWQKFRREWHDRDGWETLNNFLGAVGITSDCNEERKIPAESRGSGKPKDIEICIQDVASVYLELAHFLGDKSK